ncbi:uncharacterized protein LOC129774261 [Toxorhynchites rutilus septentrionalis]|uniref:uncharacterized protein LOC129774261 n=1 Tax=Toxorhynchites rutilus septentrionalis TaxID=329112 RepID=UPI00247AB1F0|nr:uncharacterized protein LOC129774261 [Toxorhynchites rutilus septentrionalis]
MVAPAIFYRSQLGDFGRIDGLRYNVYLQPLFLGDCLLLTHDRSILSLPHKNVQFSHVLVDSLAGGFDLRPVTVDGDEVEVVDEFVYLGSLITADNNTTKEIQRRIQAGNRAYFALRKTLWSRRIWRRTKLTVYKTLIRPVVLYGLETVTLLTEDIRALAVFERKVLRTIFGGVQTESGEWRRRMNHELQALIGEIPIVQLAKVGRLRWAAHVARMPDDSAVKSDLFNDPAGTRNRGAQRARWFDQIEPTCE